MKIVYLIQSEKDKSVYSGNTADFQERFRRHNSGQVASTRNRAPWRHVCHIIFEDNQTAYDFERYLKTGSGRAFLKKHLVLDRGDLPV